ncbi:DNA primase large subunit [Strongyloides ratti]|uniref:DNA primase large subunit n=1 Tax=Strongyloides ratti TaxID=34506 RepID=A0A090MXH3_STRRB|nr:DNA primase large subunit [Strongyloides ratti]CEF65434.1 DNA primase large subunit [Strongyloides ratti]
MELVQNKNVRKIFKKNNGNIITIMADDDSDIDNGHDLQMYAKPPTGQITISDVEVLSRKRLKILQKIEEIRERYPKNSEEYVANMDSMLREYLPIAIGNINDPKKRDIARRDDLISHFILRLAFCKNIEQTRWFLNQEYELFKYRISKLSRYEVECFLKLNNVNIEKVSSTELNQIADLLSKATSRKLLDVKRSDYYKLNFLEAINLVRIRKVYLSYGTAYVSFSDLEDIMSSRFKTNIAAAMARQNRMLSFLQEEERLIPILKNVTSKAYLGKKYNGQDTQLDGSITLNSIDQMCKDHFPPCMRNIHNTLKINNHLRYGARNQYTAFLRGIGMSLENALNFFRNAFIKKIDFDRFKKDYAYSIRHIYGQEGHRRGLNAFSCPKIILSNPPGPNDCHGCPFKHSDKRNLIHLLRNMGLTTEQVDVVLEQIKTNRFDYACTKTFEFSHKLEENSLGELIIHPNRYYELSRNSKTCSFETM